jgi:CheY-like chemotaxis protein
MRHRVLIASQPEAWVVVERMLGEVVDLVPVHTMAKAFQVLERDAASIDLIICTIAFDESQMIEFLQAVKREPTMGNVPFLGVRVLASVLSDDLVGRVGTVCKNCGAVDLLDLGRLDDGAAQTALRAAVMQHGARRPAKL